MHVISRGAISRPTISQWGCDITPGVIQRTPPETQFVTPLQHDRLGTHHSPSHRSCVCVYAHPRGQERRAEARLHGDQTRRGGAGRSQHTAGGAGQQAASAELRRPGLRQTAALPRRQDTLPNDSRVAMLKVTGANPSILQSAAGACQDLTKSTPAVTVGPEDVIWLRRVDSSGIRTLKYPIRVVAPSSVSDFHFTRRNHQDGGEGGGACAFTYRQRLCLMASLGQANFEGSQSFRPKIRASVTR